MMIKRATTLSQGVFSTLFLIIDSKSVDVDIVVMDPALIEFDKIVMVAPL